MKLGRMAVLTTSCFLLALVQFVAALSSPPVALGGAVAAGLLAPIMLKFFQVEVKAAGIMLLATGGSLAGIAPSVLGRPGTASIVGFAPILALATGGILLLSGRKSRRRCALCNRRLGSGVWFQCPRCGLSVCDQECWDFDNIRCRLCQQNRVPILSSDTRWWNTQLGPRVAQGRCQLCLSSYAEADLRACRKCSRPQCRACWDVANGQCGHCQWLISDLPPQLRAYLVPQVASSGAHSETLRSIR